MSLSHKIIFKYGQEEKEISDDMVQITQGTERLELGQYIYEFIALGIPMKRLHPKFQNESDEDTIIYKSEEDKQEMDPRWEALKKLNKN
jgi:uncharacterized metal-binding protein YceD (DUF177 family)